VLSKNNGILGLILAAAMLTTVSAARASDPNYVNTGQVNIGGATLFQNFFKSPASTNDFIDVDTDGNKGFWGSSPYVDQLADSNYLASPYWTVQYRATGSGNGLDELVAYYNTQPVEANGPPALFKPATSFAIINRTQFAAGGTIASPPGVTGDPNNHPGGTPVTPNNVDIAVMDVPTTWFVKAGSSSNAAWNKKPTQDGYGQNTKTSSTGFTNQLVSLGALNLNAVDTDSNTVANSTSVYDTTVSWVATAFMANQGTGIQDGNVKMTELQHLYVTGRMPNGENLVAGTRESASGTRNGAMNSIGVDPAFGAGENIGNQTTSSSSGNIGKNTQTSNYGSTSHMVAGVKNHRLMVGYAGLDSAATPANGGSFDILNVQKDIDANGVKDANRGSAPYVRPTVSTVLDNSDPNTGYQVGGPETFVTVGDPQATAINSTYGALNSNPQMSNRAAAAYIRNITESIAAFAGNPDSNLSYNMPGEYLAYSYFPMAAIDAVPDATNPTSFGANTVNEALQTYTQNNSTIVVNDIGTSSAPNGYIPVRTTLTGGTLYSDGSTSAYTDANGRTYAGGLKLAERNKIAGDFDDNGARNLADANQMMVALNSPRTFEQNINHGGNRGDQAGDFAITEVLGDFNGDGNFDSLDIRYFADGLAIDANGKLNRKAAFTQVDQKWMALKGTCFFADANYAKLAVTDPNFTAKGTTLRTGKPYTAGAAMADVAGKTTAAGADPRGHDYSVDANDINYVTANFGDWANLDQAVKMDLSCDMNGDLKVDANDVNEVLGVLGTVRGDSNLDGVVGTGDLSLLAGSWGMSGKGWDNGDFNGDGVVGTGDLSLLAGNWGWSHPAWAPDMQSVPEPATMTLLGLGALALIRRRK
jgi:hypothetical protein